MLEKSIVDSLIHNAMASMDIDAIKDVEDFQNILCAQLNSSSGIGSWEWQVGERYVTTGTTNKKSMTFSISGVYNDSVKVVIALVRVMDPPGNYLAFPYDVLRNGVRIELAISKNSGTASTIDSLSVVYGVSIGLTDYSSYWLNADKGQDGWSRESLKLLREQVTNFRSVATIIEPDQGDLHNAIYRGERCHLSFALNWSIMWRNLGDGLRYVYVAPSSLVEHADQSVFMYDHDRDDARFVPFLNSEAKELWLKEHKRLSKEEKIKQRQSAEIGKSEIELVDAPTMINEPDDFSIREIDINHEREQLLNHWKKVDPKRLHNKVNKLVAALQEGDLTNASMHIRKFHDILGYMAKDGPESGGKCAGCLYRSGSFMQLKQPHRISTRKNSSLKTTIHLEHLIPVVVLRNKLQELVARHAAREEILRFVLASSIAVGVHFMQRDGDDALVRPGLHANSHVFTPGHEEEGLPFRRYREIDDLGYKIFNVVTGEQVNLQIHTLEQARADLIELVKQSGNDKGLLDWLL